MRIGTTVLPLGLILAPMAGVTDATFRKICFSCGAEYAVSEMISSKALIYEQIGRKRAEYKSADLAYLSKEDTPTALQIFGSEDDTMAKAARMLANGEYRGFHSEILPVAIDINMGCPVHKVVSNGEGSALLRDLDKCRRILQSVVSSVSVPVTVKIRAGWDRETVNAVEVAQLAEACGVQAICVHARTRSDMYSPGADWDIIRRVKESVSIPVIGNGNVFSPEDVFRMRETTGCDGVMIARGALGNPWIFEDSIRLLEGKPPVNRSREERISMALRHLKEITLDKGERIGLSEVKKHLAWYTKGMRDSSRFRQRLMMATSSEEVQKILNELI